jgi:hypothetical protein
MRNPRPDKMPKTKLLHQRPASLALGAKKRKMNKTEARRCKATPTEEEEEEIPILSKAQKKRKPTTVIIDGRSNKKPRLGNSPPLEEAKTQNPLAKRKVQNFTISEKEKKPRLCKQQQPPPPTTSN